MGDILGIPIDLILRIGVVIVLLWLARAAWKTVRQHGIGVFFSIVLAFIFFFVLFAILLAGLDQIPQGGNRLLSGFENVIGWVTQGGTTAGGAAATTGGGTAPQPVQLIPVQPTPIPWPPPEWLHFESGGKGFTIQSGTQPIEEPFEGAAAAPGIFPLQVQGKTVACAENWSATVAEILRLYQYGKDITVWYEPNTLDCSQKPIEAVLETPRTVPALAPAQTGTTTHTVQAGETLSSIAQRYGVSQQAILTANPQVTNPNRIYPGQALQIPAP